MDNVGGALVRPVVLLVPLLVLKDGFDGRHNEHKSQCCCGSKPTKGRDDIPPG